MIVNLHLGVFIEFIMSYKKPTSLCESESDVCWHFQQLLFASYFTNICFTSGT